MARVLNVYEEEVECELNSGKVVTYDLDCFDWDCRPGDEFRFSRLEDGSAVIERVNRPKRIPAEDMYEDRATAEDVQMVTEALRQQYINPQYAQRSVTPYGRARSGMVCPECGSSNVQISTMQENLGSTTFSRTKTKSRKKKHGLIWWIMIGWWWSICDLFLWFFAFFPRLILHLFAKGYKKDRRVEVSNTIQKTSNKIRYITVCTCQNCGNSWER